MKYIKILTLTVFIGFMSIGSAHSQSSGNLPVQDGISKESPLNMPDKLELCGSEEGEIEIAGKFKQILWSTGAKTPYITVQDTGMYTVSVFDGIEWFKDSIHVIRVPELVRKPTVTKVLCEGSSVKLTGNTDADSWNWSSGSRKWGITVSQPGTYMVESANDCYSVTDTILVVNAGAYPTVLPQEISTCLKGNIQLSAFGPAENYRWNNGQTTKEIVVNTSGNYFVNFKICDSVYTQNFTVEIKSRSYQLYFPNIFTPNADNVNDHFRMVGNNDQISDFQISIFNRWGVLLYKSNDTDFEWNGIFNGNVVPDGVYYYGGGYKHSCSGDKFIPIEGTITVQK